MVSFFFVFLHHSQAKKSPNEKEFKENEKKKHKIFINKYLFKNIDHL